MKKNKLFLTAGLAAVLAIGIFIYALNNSKYEVKFNSNGGSKVESVMVKKNERVEAPKDPKKEGYVFVEWQLNGKSYDFKKKVTSNITLNAKWLPEIYVTVTLDSNGGSEIEPLSIISGTKLSKDDIAKPTREGYTFAGWLIGENKYDFSKKVTSDLTLKASWVEGENVTIPDEEIKDETKTEVKEDSKDETKTEVKEDSKDETKTEVKEDSKDETKTEVKEDSKDETKTEVKEDSKDETKTEVKEDSKDETKTEVKEDSKDETKTEKKKKSKKESNSNSSKKSDSKTSKESKKDAAKEETNSTIITTYKVGDKVTITGEYANSCDGNKTGYKAAISWDAEVIAVYEGQEYPYQVANSLGTIGFFKAESLKMKN